MDIEQKINGFNLNYTIEEPKPKAKGVIGNITIYYDKKFNWIQREMWKICFGLEITNLE